MTQLICNRANECGQKCAHSEPHERLWGKTSVRLRVDYCASHHCLWWTRKDGHWRQKVWCEEVADDDATEAG